MCSIKQSSYARKEHACLCLLQLMEFGFFFLLFCSNCGSLLFRSRWSIQINRRHTSAGTCGLQRDFCGSDLSTGWNGSYSKPFHSAARWLMLSLDCLWKLQGCKSLERTVSVWEASWFGGGGGFECVFDSVKKKSTFIFVAFINDERMGNVRSTFLFSSHPQSV